eukprot:gene19992-biopygen2541
MGSGGSTFARLELKGIDGMIPQGVDRLPGSKVPGVVCFCAPSRRRSSLEPLRRRPWRGTSPNPRNHHQEHGFAGVGQPVVIWRAGHGSAPIWKWCRLRDEGNAHNWAPSGVGAGLQRARVAVPQPAAGSRGLWGVGGQAARRRGGGVLSSLFCSKYSQSSPPPAASRAAIRTAARALRARKRYRWARGTPLLQEQGRAPIHQNVWCGKIRSPIFQIRVAPRPACQCPARTGLPVILCGMSVVGKCDGRSAAAAPGLQAPGLGLWLWGAEGVEQHLFGVETVATPTGFLNTAV